MFEAFFIIDESQNKKAQTFTISRQRTNLIFIDRSKHSINKSG